MNPCKCGYLNDSFKACNRAPSCATSYQSKISGPILDRFDIHIEVGNQGAYEYEHVLSVSQEESSQEIAKRVLHAREVQGKRYEGYGARLNNQLEGQLLIDYALPNDEGRNILNEAAKKFRLSMRSYNRVLRVARTIADLSGCSVVRKDHIAEALSYRQMDYFRLEAA